MKPSHKDRPYIALWPFSGQNSSLIYPFIVTPYNFLWLHLTVLRHTWSSYLFMVYLMKFPVPQTIACWMVGYKPLAHNWWFYKMT